MRSSERTIQITRPVLPQIRADIGISERAILESAVKAEITRHAGFGSAANTNRKKVEQTRRFRILGLPDKQLSLIATGEIVVCSDEVLAKQYQHPYFPDGPYLLYSLERQRVVANGVSHSGNEIDDISSTPCKMELLIKGMYLANFIQGSLNALSMRNLAELLRQYSSDEMAQNNARKINLPESYYDYLANVSNFEGRCGICSCYDAWCHSDFCWKEDGQVLLYYRWTGGSILGVTLYPEFVRGLGPVYCEPY